MSRCSSCSFDNPNGMRFCGQCGGQLPAVCVGCGFANPPGHKFCGNCGAMMPATAVASAVAPSNAPDGRSPQVPVDAERRHLTVLFCDLVDSTALADRLDPEEYRDIVKRYQNAAAEVVRRYGGSVAQFLGDGLLAYFGYPTASEDDARRAAYAALGLINAIGGLGTTSAGALAIRIGVHTGEVVAGEIGGGTGERLAVGATPNVAARLQGLAPQNAILLSAETARLLRGWFELEEFGTHELKGVSRPVHTHRLVREARRNGRLELDDAARLTPLVGREEEIALLRRRLQMARDGDGQIVVLSGEAGVGKSRLIQHMRASALEDGFTMAAARCMAVHANSALLPITDTLGDLLGLDRDMTPADAVARLEQYVDTLGESRDTSVPLLAGMLGIPLDAAYPSSGLGPQRLRALSFELLLRLLQRGAATRPTLIVVEDLHWADASTMEFLSLLVDHPPMPGLVLVLTVRDGNSVQIPMRSHVSRLTLARLSDREVRRMVEQIAGDTTLPSSLIEQVISKTDGVPVFVEELTRMVLDMGLVQRALVPTDDVASLLRIPDTLQDSLLARLDRLGEARQVAQLASVLGRTFPYSLLQAVADMPADTLATHLEQLVTAELLYVRGAIPDAQFTFKHALIQDAAYSLLLRAKRRALHEKVANALTMNLGSDVDHSLEVRAYHLSEAGRFEEGASTWLQAAMQALGRSANNEAIALLSRAKLVVEEIAEPSRRAALELTLMTTLSSAHAAQRGYNAPEAKEAVERAAQLAEELGDAPGLFWTMRGLWSAFQVAADYKRSLGLAHQMLAAAERSGRRAELLEAHWCIACACLFTNELDDCLHHFDVALALDHEGRDLTARVLVGVDPIPSALSLKAQALYLRGEIDAAMQMSRDAVAMARAMDHPSTYVYVCNQAATVAWTHGDVEATRRYSRETVELSERYGLFFAPIGALHLAWCDGNPEGIIPSIELLLAFGTQTGATAFHHELADAYRLRGAYGEALDAVARAVEFAERNNEMYYAADLLRLRGDIHRECHDVPAARAAYEEGLQLARTRGAVAFAHRLTARLEALDSPHQS